jgi:hypothetical protein
MSPSGANEEIRDLSAEEIEMIRRLRAQGRAQVVDQPSLPGYQTISIPEELAASIFGQVTTTQMEKRWNEEQENRRAAAAARMTAEVKAMFDKQQPVFGIPSVKHRKLPIDKFDGTEIYQGLGKNSPNGVSNSCVKLQ